MLLLHARRQFHLNNKYYSPDCVTSGSIHSHSSPSIERAITAKKCQFEQEIDSRTKKISILIAKKTNPLKH